MGSRTNNHNAVLIGRSYFNFSANSHISLYRGHDLLAQEDYVLLSSVYLGGRGRSRIIAFKTPPYFWGRRSHKQHKSVREASFYKGLRKLANFNKGFVYVENITPAFIRRVPRDRLDEKFTTGISNGFYYSNYSIKNVSVHFNTYSRFSINNFGYDWLGNHPANRGIPSSLYRVFPMP
jgi:hypothetical protein